MSGRSPDFTHEGATRARRALRELCDALSERHARNQDRFKLIDDFLVEAQRFAPFEKNDEKPPQGETIIDDR